MKEIITKFLLLSIFIIFGLQNTVSQTPAFTWNAATELITGWDDAGPATVIKSANGITFEQIGTIGVANTYIRVNNSNNINNLIALNTTSDALTITSATENISKIKITYSSNGSTSFSNPYVGFHSTPSAMGSAVAVVSSCIISDGVTGVVGVEQTYTPPAGTKFAVIVRGLACGDIASPAREFRVFKIEVYTAVNSPIISSFSIAGVDATIDQTNKTIKAELPYGTNLTALTPVVTIGGTATSYSPTGAVNFSAGPVTFTATNGSTSTNYTVTITASSIPSSDATLKELLVDGTIITGFNPEILTYNVVLPYTHTENPVVSATVNDSKATLSISQVSAIPGSAVVTVTAQNNSQKVYTINFTRLSASSKCDITSFSINGKLGIIDTIANTINVRMHLNTDLTNLTPTVITSDLATYTPLTAQNFTNPVQYTVTAQDGTQKTYTVSVQLVNMVFYGPYPYETNFPTGYVIPDWMGSPTGSISFTDPYGTPTTGSDKVLWYDNATETSAGTASVIRISGGNPLEMYLSNCTNITAGLSATGTRTYHILVNDVIKTSSASTARDTKVLLSYAVNSTGPVKISIKSTETTSAITLGYLKIEGIGTSIPLIYLQRINLIEKKIINPEHIQLQVFDIAGRLIISSNDNIDLSTYPNGIYFVKHKNETLKFVHYE